MSTPNKDRSTFPIQDLLNYSGEGLTKRETFALFAMHALVSRPDRRSNERVCAEAWQLADTMLGDG